MLNDIRLKQLQELTGSFSNDELLWTQGFLAGVLSTKTITETIQPPSRPKKITIVYGSETGNSKNLATRFALKAKQLGINSKLSALDQYRFSNLEKEEILIVVISTHGEGEPPAPAKKFYEYLHSESPSLTNTRFAVVGLGDSAYPLFCKAGEDVDSRLVQLGATRLHPILKCDVDYESEALYWFDHILNNLTESKTEPVKTEAKVINKKGRKFYNGTILTSINLNGRGSNKETYHIEIGCEETIIYQPGDALGIIPENRKDIVHHLIKFTGVDPNLSITTNKAKGTVQEILTQHVNICHLSTNNLKNIASITGLTIPDIRMDLIDILRLYPIKNADQFVEVIKILSPITPRLYSISSSPTAHENEIHLTVSQNSFLAQNELKFGLCSQFIGELEEGTSINFYIHQNQAFKLPAPDKDVIMIGPGSGIAAMRSFLHERDSSGATGRNWLFFGDQHFTSDFLYQTEIQKWLETGVLTKLSTAFSRDQEEKVYVQHKILKETTELQNWLSHGASIYVSGSREPMSKDVESALLKVIESQGKNSKEEAVEYLSKLKEEDRYLLDVY